MLGNQKQVLYFCTKSLASFEKNKDKKNHAEEMVRYFSSLEKMMKDRKFGLPLSKYTNKLSSKGC
jgi:hypothetical protein